MIRIGFDKREQAVSASSKTRKERHPAVVLLLGALFIAGFGGGAWRTWLRMEYMIGMYQSGARVQGLVVKSEEISNEDGGPTYLHLTYSYRLSASSGAHAMQKVYRAEGDVKESLVKQLRVGQGIEVVYDRARPDKSTLSLALRDPFDKVLYEGGFAVSLLIVMIGYVARLAVRLGMIGRGTVVSGR